MALNRTKQGEWLKRQAVIDAAKTPAGKVAAPTARTIEVVEGPPPSAEQRETTRNVLRSKAREHLAEAEGALWAAIRCLEKAGHQLHPPVISGKHLRTVRNHLTAAIRQLP
jgi:hypothetical protein